MMHFFYVQHIFFFLLYLNIYIECDGKSLDGANAFSPFRHLATGSVQSEAISFSIYSSAYDMLLSSQKCMYSTLIQLCLSRVRLSMRDWRQLDPFFYRRRTLFFNNKYHLFFIYEITSVMIMLLCTRSIFKWNFVYFCNEGIFFLRLWNFYFFMPLKQRVFFISFE